MTRAVPLTKCPECRGAHFVQDCDGAEVVCADCGLVLTEKMVDKGPEWREFTTEQRTQRRRVGGPVTFSIHDKGLATTIGWGNQDAAGRALTAKQRVRFYRMRKWQRRARLSNSTERNLIVALTSISRICNSLRAPASVLETGSVLYRKALKHRLIRGRSIQGVVAACVYMACRKCQVARTLDEVAHSSRIDRKDVARAYRFLRKKLRETVPLSSPIHYVSRLINHLELDVSAELLALRMIRGAEQAHLTHGKGPLSICAAAIYVTSIVEGDRKTQRQLSEETGVTEVTIRNRYQDLLEDLEITIKL